nr:hypothetical protein [Streptomyces finlayi]
MHEPAQNFRGEFAERAGVRDVVREVLDAQLAAVGLPGLGDAVGMREDPVSGPKLDLALSTA